MASKDAAFLWESEAIRSSRVTGRHERRIDLNEPADWVTLKQAEAATGIPAATIRKWSRKGAIESYLEPTPTGHIKRVSLSAVEERAMSLGREIEPTPAAPPPTEPASRVATTTTRPPPAVPSQENEPIEQNETLEVSEEPETPPGTMLVPIDAWDKMLLQLGNLHQAGQQLAEARERAAKAETEAKFLRERLGEARDELARRSDQPKTEPTPPVRKPATSYTKIEIAEDDETMSISDDAEDILVRDLSSDGESDRSNGPDEGELTVSEYSIEMIKHIYSTWLGRPRR